MTVMTGSAAPAWMQTETSSVRIRIRKAGNIFLLDFIIFTPVSKLCVILSVSINIINLPDSMSNSVLQGIRQLI